MHDFMENRHCSVVWKLKYVNRSLVTACSKSNILAQLIELASLRLGGTDCKCIPGNHWYIS